MNKKTKAFTLIELLVVIVIIGILATISVATFNGYFVKTRATKIAQELRSIEKSFKMASIELDRDVFPTEAILGLGSNPSIMSMVNNDQLKNIPANLKAVGLGSETYYYDNDGDIYLYRENCPGVATGSGANFWINNATDSMDIVEELDKIFDKSDGLNCRKIRTYSVYMHYNLSSNQ